MILSLQKNPGLIVLNSCWVLADQLNWGLLTLFPMFSTCMWNVRGIKGKGKIPNLLKLIQAYRVDIVVILEPINNGSFLPHLAKKLGMRSYYHGNPRNHQFWWLWNSNVEINDFVVFEQCITGQVKDLSTGTTSAVTAVYASSDRKVKEALWDHLLLMSEDNKTPWILGGDYNSILGPDEKLGGAHSDPKAVEDFRIWRDDSGLLDMGFEGPKYI